MANADPECHAIDVDLAELEHLDDDDVPTRRVERPRLGVLLRSVESPAAHQLVKPPPEPPVAAFSPRPGAMSAPRPRSSSRAVRSPPPLPQDPASPRETREALVPDPLASGQVDLATIVGSPPPTEPSSEVVRLFNHSPSWEVVGAPRVTASDAPVALSHPDVSRPRVVLRQLALVAVGAGFGIAAFASLRGAQGEGDAPAGTSQSPAPLVVAMLPLEPGEREARTAERPASSPPVRPALGASRPEPTRLAAGIVPRAAESPAPASAGIEPPPPSQPTIEEALPFPREAAAAAIAAATPQASSCASDVAFTARVRVTFAPSGRATQTSVGGDFAGTPVGSCIVAAFASVRVPAFGGEPVTVVKSVEIAAAR